MHQFFYIFLKTGIPVAILFSSGHIISTGCVWLLKWGFNLSCWWFSLSDVEAVEGIVNIENFGIEFFNYLTYWYFLGFMRLKDYMKIETWT